MKRLPLKKSIVLVSLLALVASYAWPLVPSVNAAQAGESYLRFSRMMAGEDPGDTLVVFTTSSEAQTEGKFKITLDSEWVSDTNFSSTNTNWTFTVTGIPGSSTAMPLSGSNATDVTGNTVTFGLTGALDASTEYAFIITGGLTENPAASTSIIHDLFSTTSGDATIDEIQVASPTISDDQISIQAAVPPSFTFVFGGNSDDLGTMSTASVNSGSGNAITITTNATNGWYAWALSANAALSSAALSYTIDTAGSIDGSPTTISGGTEGYVLDVDLTTDAGGGGTVAIAGEYDGGSTSAGGTLATTFQQIASADGTGNGDVITLIPRATIAGQTPAATDYADTLTVVGAGRF